MMTGCCRLGLGLALLSLLAACQTTGSEPTGPRPTGSQAAPTVTAEPAAAANTPDPVPAQQESIAALPEPTDKLPATPPALPPPAPSPAPSPDANPETLMGLDRDALRARLGEPGLIRVEAPAEVWQYRGPDCVFDLVLYPDNGSRTVTYLEARDLKAEPTAAGPCLTTLLQARRTAATS